MKHIAFDLHGMVDLHPETFRPLMEILVANCIKVSILSGPPKNQIEHELADLGYFPEQHYHEVYSIVDFLKDKGCLMWQDDSGRWWSSPEDWWPSKAEMIKLFGIDVLIDNSEAYEPFIDKQSTIFLLLK
jgi:hypothetical protein